MARKFIYQIARKSQNADYDEAINMVIVAENVILARRIAADNCNSEGRTVWFKSANIRKIGYAVKGQKPGLITQERM